jgi:hypothetical protein
MQTTTKKRTKAIQYTKEQRLEHCLRVRDAANKAKCLGITEQDPFVAVFEFCSVMIWDFNEVLPHVTKEVQE